MTSVAVVGAGAIGAWLADALGRGGWSVSMVARGATLQALRERGLKVSSEHESHLTRPRAGTALELGVHDYVFLTVKAQALPGLAPSLSPLIGPATRVVSGTNGIPWWFFQGFDGPLAGQRLQSVDPDGSQARLFPPASALGCVVHATARVTAPAVVEVIAADRLLLGEPHGVPGENVRALARALQAAGLNAQVSERIRLDVWDKLLGNMAFSPLSALTRSGTGRMFADADLRELCAGMMAEMQQCGRRLGLASDMTPAQRIDIAMRLGDFKPSMLADLDAGRALELAPQLGAVAEIAVLLQQPAPLIKSVLAMARLLDRAAADSAALKC